MFILYDMNSYVGEVKAALAEKNMSPLDQASETPLEKTNMTLTPKGMKGFSNYRTD